MVLPTCFVGCFPLEGVGLERAARVIAVATGELDAATTRVWRGEVIVVPKGKSVGSENHHREMEPGRGVAEERKKNNRREGQQ